MPATKIARNTWIQYNKIEYMNVKNTKNRKIHGKTRKRIRRQIEFTKLAKKLNSRIWWRDNLDRYAWILANDKWRFCHTETESINHLVSGCKTLLADEYYTTLHNNISKYLHWRVCREEKIDVNNNIWDHELKAIVTNKNITIFYDKIIPTRRYIEGNVVKLT